MSLLQRARLRLRALVGRDRIERELAEELQFHLDMQTEQNLRAGMTPGEARRQALLLFGGVEGHKEASRTAQGLDLMGLRASWLDVKLGLRMLRKYPGLTVVGGLALAVALGLAAAWFEVTNDFVNPRLPLAEGERVVAVRNWDAAASSDEPHAVHDFLGWRREARSIQELGAFMDRAHNLITGDGRAEPVGVAAISASAFRVARVPPLLGRPLVEADEREGAPMVLVIGHRLWRSRFGGDPRVVGQAVRLGETPATVVGVMPEGFAFPVNHGAWVPLRATALASAHERLQGPAIRTFGRLAPGVTLEEAQAELTTLGRRAAADFPLTHRHLRPQVVPYVDSFVEGGHVLHVGNAAFLMILVVVCANVAALVYARTATRVGEITVRSALGATRGRILAQLFAESLVLVAVAAVAALAIVKLGMRWGMEISFAVDGGAPPPFWWDAGLAPATIAYVAGLAVVAAALVGIPPALRATGRQLQPGLQRLAAGSPGMRFGGGRTAAIVAQVALTVAFLPEGISEGRALLGKRGAESGFPAGEYLSARIAMDAEAPPAGQAAAAGAAGHARIARVHEELRRRLASEPGVAGVTLASRLPGMNHPSMNVEVEGGQAAAGGDSARWVRTALVDGQFFAALDIPLLAGRALAPRDFEPGSAVAVVSQSFARRFLAGGDPVGRRIRPIGRAGAEPAPWLEIVGVVGDVTVSTDATDDDAAVFRPLLPGRVNPVHLAVRAGPNPEAFAPRLRASALAVDPTLRLYDVRPLDRAGQAERRMQRFFTLVFALIGLAAVFLSTAGIYSLVSFTVSQRTREIGIRSALGAQPRRIVLTIFSRAVAQLGLGVAAGCLLAALVGDQLALEGPGVLLGMAALMLGVGLLACVVPARRALRVQPTEALKAGG